MHHHVSEARQRLRDAGITPTESDLDARLLAQHVLGWSTERFLTDAREPEPDGFRPRYDALVARRVTREPLAYIVGLREFWGLELEVTPDVLIPRPATELIVEADSGAVSRSIGAAVDRRRLHRLRLRRGGARARAAGRTDQSGRHLAARARGRARATRRATASPIASRSRSGDLLDGVTGTFDAIVANPPYVIDRARPALQPEVRDHEPSVALFGGIDGLSLVTRLVAAAPSRLRAGGYLIFEFGLGQDVEVEDLIEASPGADAGRPAARPAGHRAHRHREAALESSSTQIVDSEKSILSVLCDLCGFFRSCDEPLTSGNLDA